MDTDLILTELARRAERVDGLVTRGDLRSAGLTDDAIKNLVRRGRLLRTARGVFRFPGSGQTPRQALRAGLLHVGPAAAARRWALWVHGLLGGAAPGGRLPCLLVPYGASVRGGPDLCLHRSRSFTGDQRLVVAGLAVVTLERALLESWPELSQHRWRDVTARALQLGRTDVTALQRTLDQLGRVRGAGRIVAELERIPAQVARARSTGEVELLAAFARAGLPEPVLNHAVTPAGGQRRELDAAFPDLRLAYELDGASWHTTPDQVQSDQVRDLNLAAAGWRIHRVPARLLGTPAKLEGLLRSTFEAHAATSV